MSNNENYSRVRQIPITIETRRGRSNLTPQQPHQEYTSHHQHRDQNSSSPFDHKGNVYDPSETFPNANTSSININYKPATAPKRNQNNQHTSQIPTGQYDKNEYRGANVSSAHDLDDYLDDHSFNENHEPTTRNPTTQEDSSKLVNSPEPIPLPPPPSSTPTPQAPQKQTNTEQSHQSQNVPATHKSKVDPNMDAASIIDEIKSEVRVLLEGIANYRGTTKDTKEYRTFDEMLTRCTLRLDNIDCGGVAELRNKRKAAIKLIDQATEILQKKQKLNKDIDDLTASLSSNTNTS